MSTRAIYRGEVLAGWIYGDDGECQNIRCREAVAEGRAWHAIPAGFGVTLPDYHFATEGDAAAALEALVPLMLAPGSGEVPVLDRWGRQVLTVGQLRRTIAHLDDDVQVVMDDGDSWYRNVSFIGVPFRDEEQDYSPWSALTLGAGDPFDTRQI